MAIEIKLPALGENIDSATVAAILVSAGDNIVDQQAIMEVDTEKAAIEVPASATGRIKEVLVKQGDVIEVGQTLLTLEETSAKEAPSPAAETSAKETPLPAAETGAKERPSPTGAPQKPARPNGPPPSAQPSEADKPSRPSTDERDTELAEPGQQPREPSDSDIAAAAPYMRRMARELGIDINEVTGTGPDGRITEDNVRNYARSIILNASGVKDSAPGALPDFSRWGNIERKPMTGVRRKTAEHMQTAWSVPHVTHFDTADITHLEELRAAFAKKVEKAGGKLTITAITLKAAASALSLFPQCNVTFDGAREEIIFKEYIHIGVAVNTERGLLVPVIRDVNKKNIVELSVELSEMAEKARDGKLRIEDMQGGTFSITNLGGIGLTNFTPIINSPEAAILGMSRASHQPVYRGEELTRRLILPLALSFDHRVIDGAEAARFLRWIAEALESPFLLALEG